MNIAGIAIKESILTGISMFDIALGYPSLSDSFDCLYYV